MFRSFHRGKKKKKISSPPCRQFSADSPGRWPATACPSSARPSRQSKFPGSLPPPQDQTAWGFPSSTRHPGNPPIWPHTNPASSKSPQPAFEASARQIEVWPFLPSRSQPAYTGLPRSIPRLLPKGAEGLRQVPPQARRRGLSSGSGPSSTVSVSGRCALGTGRRWLAPWLRLLSRRRLLLPVARAAGRSGVLVSDAAEV